MSQVEDARGPGTALIVVLSVIAVLLIGTGVVLAVMGADGEVAVAPTATVQPELSPSPTAGATIAPVRPRPTPETTADVVAYSVDGRDVTVVDLIDRLRLAFPDVVPAAETPDAAAEVERLALEDAVRQLITVDILQAQAETQGIVVSDAEVDDDIQRQLAGTGEDLTDLEARLEAEGGTIEAVQLTVRLQLLVERLLEVETGEITPSSEEVQQIYDLRFADPLVSHILVETESDAREVIARVTGGEDFGDVAREVSLDPGSGEVGGDLGPLRPGLFVPEFEEAALALEVGQLSDPVETPFGFHVIRLAPPPPLEDVREEIEDQIRQDALRVAQQALAARLDETVIVEVDPRFGTWEGFGASMEPS
ncbi:hypothetical protein BH23ACT9_BH23ACT9_28180 [soil metagenome]